MMFQRHFSDMEPQECGIAHGIEVGRGEEFEGDLIDGSLNTNICLIDRTDLSLGLQIDRFHPFDRFPFTRDGCSKETAQPWRRNGIEDAPPHPFRPAKITDHTREFRKAFFDEAGEDLYYFGGHTPGALRFKTPLLQVSAESLQFFVCFPGYPVPGRDDPTAGCPGFPF